MKKFNYFLLPAEVRFEVKGVTNLVKFDTLTKKDEPFITMHDLGQAQQAAQVRLFREVMEPSPDVIVRDVCILAVSHLGEMTEEEFMAAPEPMPSDTKPEDKPAQEAVEASSVKTAPVPLEPLDIPPADAPSVPAEPTNEADQG